MVVGEKIVIVEVLRGGKCKGEKGGQGCGTNVLAKVVVAVRENQVK